MNLRYLFNQLALLLLVMSGVLLVLELAFLGVAAASDFVTVREATTALIATGIAGGMIGFSAWFSTRSKDRQIHRRDALLLVSASWIVGAGFAATPYFIWAHAQGEAASEHPFRSFVDCYFEAMSGLTTTGATVLTDIESLPPGLLLWRAFTHWLGGLGIVVLFVAVLPSLGVGGKRLYKIEAPGPRQDSVTPNIRETARMLWFIYLGLTIVEVALLMMTGMNPFDATCHTFATVATGGFSTENESVGAYGRGAMIVIIVFMTLAGMNFGLFYELIRGRWKNVLADTELRVYLIMLLLGSAVVVASLYMSSRPIESTSPGTFYPSTFGNSLLEGAFTTVSIQTTTGFCTSDFDLWPFAGQAVLVFLMLVGGCGGSTAGGIKVGRLWVALKILFAEVEHAFRPNVIRPVRLGKASIDESLKRTTLAYAFGFMVLVGAGSFGVMMLEEAFNPEVECTYTTASTASIATICTIGPGLDQVGAIRNYGWMSEPTKILLSILMVMGRLEVFAILVLFHPKFWRGD